MFYLKSFIHQVIEILQKLFNSIVEGVWGIVLKNQRDHGVGL